MAKENTEKAEKQIHTKWYHSILFCNLKHYPSLVYPILASTLLTSIADMNHPTTINKKSGCDSPYFVAVRTRKANVNHPTLLP